MRKDLDEAFLATERIRAEKESLSSIRIPRSQQDLTRGIGKESMR